MAAAISWRENRLVQDRIKRAIAYTIVMIMAVAYIFPLYWLVVTALKTDVEIFQQPPPIFPPDPQWQNFGASTTYIPFWRYMWNTIAISGLTVLGTVLSCTFIAYGFARIQWPGRNLFFLIYLSTIMLPSQVTLIPLYLIFRDLGWVGTFLPLVVPHFFGSALYVFLLRQFLLTIPQELSDAARIDGASELGILWHVMIPLMRPAMAVVALFTFVQTYRDFLGPLIYLQNQQDWTISLGLKLFQNMYGAQWQLMMAASTLAMLPTIVLFFFTQKTFVRGIALTGLKG
ncbi:MAG: carbohydrate ABC transporter permease [Chloroflexi bacterium]|nr:carbohydrate ABC transporter permease [Chloroflexota bacterium]MCY3583030.1 carbohydrate ABC transporter permease [Chloroflexota bacterium]MCY3714953.1 carbohydrate ABC transporter permease [Chloroflexota bacterium]MDE2650881.1 carbohydrate ABC transporter permease [Chloroflexota bacterium]